MSIPTSMPWNKYGGFNFVNGTSVPDPDSFASWWSTLEGALIIAPTGVPPYVVDVVYYIRYTMVHGLPLVSASSLTLSR